MRWAPARSIMITFMMLTALGCIVAGVAQIYRPAGWIAAGVGIAYLAIVHDQDEPSGGPKR